MIGQLNNKQRAMIAHQPPASPQIRLFALWMLGWMVGLLLANTYTGQSPVMLAYLLVMLTSGVWAVGLSMLPHLPRVPVARRLIPKPLEVIPEALLRRPEKPADPYADLAEECYFLCDDGDLIPVTDRDVLAVIDESDREMHRRQ